MGGILCVSYIDADNNPQHTSMKVKSIMGSEDSQVICERVGEEKGLFWTFTIKGISPSDLCAAFRDAGRSAGHCTLAITVDGDIGPANQFTKIEEFPGFMADQPIPVTAAIKFPEPAAV